MDSDKNQTQENVSEENAEVQGVPPTSKEGTDPLEQARKAAEAAQKEVLYVKAEFDNYRKRILKEQEQAIKYANKQLISELLNVVDYFDRAIQHSKTLKTKSEPEVANFVSGVEMSHHELTQLLSRFGVEFVGQVGEKFDPERHEAVGQKESEKSKVDTVLEIFQKGSMLHGRLIKPAKVIVGTEKN